PGASPLPSWPFTPCMHRYDPAIRTGHDRIRSGPFSSADRNIGPPKPCTLRLSGVAPVVDAERHHLDRREIVVDRHILVVGVHDGRRSRHENDGRRIGVLVEEAGIGRALTTA